MKKKYKVQGIDILIDESDQNVFQPHPITKLLANSIKIKPTDIVLEVCSGSGLIAITAAKLGAKKVFASDISQLACVATKNNGILNGLNGELQVKNGAYFEPFKNMKFNVIVSNPPCMPFPKGAHYKNEGLSLAVDGGEDGIKSTIELLLTAEKYLEPDGIFYLPIPKWSNYSGISKLWKDTFSHEIVKSGYVNYYLANYSSIFSDHIQKLLSLEEVSFKSINGSYLAEILIYKLKRKNLS